MKDINSLFKEGFHLISTKGIEIHMPINAKISIISGNSATGKTKMMNDLADIIENDFVKSCNIEPSRIKVLKDRQAFDFFMKENSVRESIIFIDNFELTNINRSAKFIEHSYNIFVISCKCRLPKISCSLDSALSLTHDGKIYDLEPIDLSNI